MSSIPDCAPVKDYLKAPGGELQGAAEHCLIDCQDDDDDDEFVARSRAAVRPPARVQRAAAWSGGGSQPCPNRVARSHTHTQLVRWRTIRGDWVLVPLR